MGELLKRCTGQRQGRHWLEGSLNSIGQMEKRCILASKLLDVYDLYVWTMGFRRSCTRPVELSAATRLALELSDISATL